MARPRARPAASGRLAGGCLLAGLLAHEPAGASQPPVRDPATPVEPLHRPGADDCAEDAGRFRVVPQLLKVTVNNRASGRTPLFLRRPCGALLARDTDLEALRIRTAERPAVQINGQRWLNLNEFRGLTYALDAEREQVRLEGEPWIFYPTVVDFDNLDVPKADPSPPGAFLNYGGAVGGRFGNSDSRVAQANVGLGVFGRAGVLTTDFYGLKPAVGESRVYRAASTFVHDFPAETATFRAGDILSRAGVGGATVLMGGVQYATNFLLRPYRIITPVTEFDTALARDGRVRLGQTVFGDPDPRRALTAPINAPYGPVEIRNVSATENLDRLYGVREGAGPENLFTTRTFYAQGLLKQGLNDFSYEAGPIRTSLIDDRYGRLFFSGTQRHGFTRWLTGEAHLEVLRSQINTGLAASLAVPYLGVFSPGVALSRPRGSEDPGAGVLYRASLDNRYQRFSWFGLLERRSREFRDVLDATLDPISRLKQQEVASVSYTLPWQDTASVSYFGSTDYAANRFRSAQVSYSTRLLRDILVNAYAARQFASRIASANNTYGVFISLPLKALTGRLLTPTQQAQLGDPAETLFHPDHTFIQASVMDSTSGRPSGSVSVNTGRQTDDGFLNVQVQQALFADSLTGVGAFYTGSRFYASGRLARANGDDFYSLAGGGGLVYMDGGLFATPPVSNGFALVRLGPQNGGVRIGNTRTNANGDAVVTSLAPYVVNSIAINPLDLPFNSQLDGLSLSVVPRFRSGVVVRASIRYVRDVLVRVLVTNRQGQKVPLPLGAYALVDPLPAAEKQAAKLPGKAVTGEGPPAGTEDAPEPVPAGRGGLLYFANVTTDRLSATVALGDQRCHLAFDLPPPSRDDIPEIGPLLCEGITP